jgi:hypothetical protein
VRGVVVPFNASANRGLSSGYTDLSFDGLEAARYPLASCFYFSNLCKNAILTEITSLPPNT